MPSSKLLNAARTALDGEGASALFGLWLVDGVPVDFVATFGVGEAFGSTVRVRVVVVEEFEFWANANMALTNTIEAMTRNLFNMIGSSRFATEAQRHRD
jgi:hypothetical protein